MKRLTYFAACALAAALTAVMCSCSTHPKGKVMVSPEAAVLTPDINNNIDFDVDLYIPSNYISKRSMAVIEPVLLLGGEVAQTFEPVVIQGRVYSKKEQRFMRLYHREPVYTSTPYVLGKGKKDLYLNINEEIHLSDDFDSGKVVAYVTVDGCGECYGTDVIDLAYLSNLSNLIDLDNMLVEWIDTVMPATVKTFEGHGVARLQFEINKSDILPGLANNEAEMNEMLRALTPVLKDSLSTLDRMSIFGSASAEGIYKKNVALAQSRAQAAKEWLNRELSLTPRQRNLIKVGSDPEGWGPVIASMHAAGDPDSALVKQIVERYPDLKSGQAEKQIRKLKCWPRIAEYHLAKDRKVTYDYSWTIKSFDTDDEVMAMYRKRPDALNEPEFLRVARLLEEVDADDDQMIELYETLVRYFPSSKVGVNNLAVLYYENGRYADAKDLLESRPLLDDEMVNTLALCCIETGDTERAIDLLSTLGSSKARYNLGALLASTHRMAEAYPYLADAADLNAAVAALGVNSNEEAWQILSALDDGSPKADYIRAIARARLGDKEGSIGYLSKAVADPRLKARASTEADFIPLLSLPAFQQIINQ